MPGLTTTQAGYGARHQATRAEFARLVAEGGARCARCGRAIHPGEPWDLGHVDGDRSRYAGVEHRRCNRATSSRRWQPPPPEPDPEPQGIAQDDERWDVPWLATLRQPPADAVWPRYMTVPHPRAVGSLGADFIAWAEERSGPLRWWQRLVAVRLLEVDAAGDLVWETIVLSMARQLGKSWLLRELCLWRIHQGGRFGEPQDVMHTGKEIAICKEVQRSARIWAKIRGGAYKVREVNGQEEIELVADGSRWMLRAKNAVYGYGVSLAAVDEAWKVPAASVDDGLIPTMAERAQPQLLLVSTAHRLSTTLMLQRRQVALADLHGGDGDLIVEWSAPRGVELEDLDAWRSASPHWTPKRERLIRRQLAALRAGDIIDPEEPDPEASFRSQWLNSWPGKLAEPPGNTEPFLPAGLWLTLADPELWSDGPVIVAMEDDFGHGAGVAAACRHPDGRIEVDAWGCVDWDSAIDDVLRLQDAREISELHVGASMLDRLPYGGDLPVARAAIHTQTAGGLSLFRDLASTGMLAHNAEGDELDRALKSTQVRESPTGLQIARGPRALVKALVWATAAAHRPAKVPAVH